MKNQVKYKDYRIGWGVYTVKLTYKPQGGFYYTPIVKVDVMRWHQPPRNLWQKIAEFWQYNLNSYVWDPTLTEASLESYCIDKCKCERTRERNIERGDKEWEVV